MEFSNIIMTQGFKSSLIGLKNSRKDILLDFLAIVQFIDSLDGATFIGSQEYKNSLLQKKIKYFDSGVFELKINSKQRFYFMLHESKILFFYEYYKQDQKVKDNERKKILKLSREIKK